MTVINQAGLQQMQNHLNNALSNQLQSVANYVNSSYGLTMHAQGSNAHYSASSHSLVAPRPPKWEEPDEKIPSIEHGVKGHLQGRVSKWLKGVELPIH